MARKDKYNKLKAQISKPTMLIAGLVFLALILVIVFSIDTPKQKFDKKYGFETKNDYALTTLSKLEKILESEDNVLVVITNITVENNSATLIPELQKAYDKTDEYEKYSYDKIDGKYTKIYYIETTDITEFSDFFKTNKVKNTSTLPMIIAFEKGQKPIEYALGHSSIIVEDNADLAKIRLSLRDFFVNINK